jgi:general stress protein YciG
MNPKDSGHKGGIATRDKYPTLCPLCGHLIKSQFFSENGQKGGEATFKRYGREHYVEMGLRGGRPKSTSAAESSGPEIQEGLELLPAPGSREIVKV